MRNFGKLGLAVLCLALGGALLSACEEHESHKIEVESKPGKLEVKTK